ncbi:MAG: MBL fold metallo-hydrolase [Chloroflexi bacterium]|nr:MBL fold metallo-hydrolase [Chloroflexota bacterium]MCY3583177.1 MBL fold metallo-hydrolase [Chloroflexota bacterium]MCY3716051.1 MBL fold metallo-hydrolase [Chloroflexota bacterium]MDE2651372.1 MBL fold metallo-hydrolase [Chloroflexota bacterium]MXV93253.1 MBL fold metallo-hydrolase [Chloroflexota bacterium]
MTFAIKSLTLGAFATNAYLVADTETNKALLIDPVDSPEVIQAAAAEAGWRIEIMVATHAHLDHVLAADALKQKLQIPFIAHKDAPPLLREVPQQGQYFGLGRLPAPPEPDYLVDDGDIISLDSIELKCLYTPGHAPAHISLLMEKAGILFSGDTLFAGSIGRADLPGGDHALLMRSIFDRLMTLDDSVRVLPGHMGGTTIGHERRTNPFLLTYR